MNEYAVITAYQRSGTNAFREILRKNKSIIDHGEVFVDPLIRKKMEIKANMPDRLVSDKGIQSNFWTNKQRMISKDSSLVIPRFENQQWIWRGFCEYVFDDNPLSINIIDIKYNSLHHLDSLWRSPTEFFDLAKMIRNDNAPVIHVIRKNTRAQAFSIIVAEKIGKWAYTSDDNVEDCRPKDRIRIDIDEIILRSDTISRMSEQVSEGFGEYDNYLELYYEELFDNEGKIADKVISKIELCIGCNIVNRPSTFVRTPIYDPSIIVNIEEVLEFIHRG